MNFLPREFPLVSIFNELKMEPYQIKDYIQKRFRDITYFIKSDPMRSSITCLALACVIYSVTIPILTFPIIIILDYLDNSYFLSKEPPLAFYYLLANLKLQQAYNPLKLDLERFEEDPYVLERFKEDPYVTKMTEIKEMTEIIKEMTEIYKEMTEIYKELQNLCQGNLYKQKTYENDSRPVILFLKAKSDHNGALNQENVIINGDSTKGVQELKKKYKIVLIDDITNINQIKDGLEKITNKIQQVWILAHGSPTSMRLDEDSQIELSNIDDLADVMQQKLSKDADIVLFSCSTGKDISKGENIATKFSKILPGRTIYAPKSPTGLVTWDLGENFSTVNFWNEKSRLNFLIKKIGNICCLRPFEKIEVEINVTAQFKNGVKI